MTHLISPPYTQPSQYIQTMVQQGYALLESKQLGLNINDLEAMCESWDDLPPDNYLKDGGRYRRRRHSCFVVDGTHISPVAHRHHWQPIAYNALHGGMERWFEPIAPQTMQNPAWSELLRALSMMCSHIKGEQAWYIEAHQFRIDTTDGIGRPTPEGAHRDGVDFVAVVMVGRSGIKGGETRVFEAQGPNGQRFTLSEPWSILFLDDEKVIHESTPIQPLVQDGHRDTLVLTFRRGGFQDESV